MNSLRKLLALALLAVFGLPFVSPLLAYAASGDSSLPACCRRAGKHHCAMSMGEREQAATNAPQLQAPLQKCPFCPATISAIHDSNVAAPAAHLSFTGLVAAPTKAAQAESWLRIARTRSRHKRGPPVTIFL